MRVLHVHAPGPEPPILVRFQAKLPGVEAKLLRKGYDKGAYHGWKIFFALRHFIDVNVVNYHSALWLWRPRFIRHLDPYLAKFAGAELFFTFQGSDVRVARADLELKDFLSKTNVSVYNPDLMDFMPNAVWMPYAIDTERWSTAQRRTGPRDNLTIGYYDNPRPDIYIHQRLLPKALKLVKSKGFDVELKPCFGIPPERMEMYYDSIDLYVDIRSFGWYGDGPCEASLRNAAPITWIKEKYMYLVNSKQFFTRTQPTPEDLARTIIYLEDENVRRKAVEDAKRYVVKRHAAEKVAIEFLKWYRRT